MATPNDNYALAMQALKGLMDNPHINLEDKIYDVRESEGRGWDGPSVKAWSDAIDKAKQALKNYEGRT